jgi:2-dehydropantoate 2-reductase
MSDRFATVAVVGAGAVGCFYGARLAAAGARVTLIGRPLHVDAIRRDGLKLEMDGRVQTLRVTADTDLAAAHGADLVLVCVKSTDTADLARDLTSVVRRDAVVLSLQNGVENAPTLAAQLPATVIAAVVYVATSMAAPGVVRHHGRGELIIGKPAPPADGATAAVLQDLVAFFGRAGIGVSVSDDVRAELWAKLLVNCAYNAISALAQAPYAQLAALAEVREVQDAVVREVVVLAQAEGIALQLEASRHAVERIAQTMPGQLSSTAQDLARRKPSEIDHLNGFIARRGRERGVPVPVNTTLHALVKLVEATHARSA